MLDKFFYENNNGKRVVFGEGGLYANYNDLRDYEWSYSDDNNIIDGFYKEPVKKSLPIVIVKNSLSERIAVRNSLFEVFESDILAGKKGRIYIGGWYLKCWITAIENSSYLIHRDFTKADLTVITDEPFWIKEEIFSYSAVNVSASGGIDFPFDLPIDLQSSNVGQNTVSNSQIFPAAFKITVYGPSSNPVMIKIGGHTYQVNVGLNSGENLVIDSMNKTITKVLQDRAETSVMRYRYKKESVFEEIQPGQNELIWSGDFGFDILLYHKRSEPDWESLTGNIGSSDAPTPAPGGSETEDMSVYLLDSSGEPILDSNNNRIEL
jgi:hypothetical protein|nr:MAG TPA: tail protein [Caudoviricetes sp.]